MSEISIPITGVGLVTGFGLTRASLDAVFAGGVNDRPLRLYGLADSARTTGGGLPEELADSLRELAPDDDPAMGMILAAAAEARGLAPAATLPIDAGLALVLATNFAFQETLEWCWQERLDTGGLDPETFARWQNLVNDVGDRVGAGGRRCQLSLSCASGAGAVAVAVDLLQTGKAARVLVIAYDALTTTCWTGLSNLRTITDDCIRPFDSRRRGTVFGEAAAAMVLDPDGSATVAIGGAATNNNAFHMTAPARRGDGSRRAMTEAIAQSNLPPNSISFVSAHATGTLANDTTETEALLDLFSGAPPPVLALKSSLSHLLGAAGLAEAIVAAEAIHRGILPAIQNSEEPAPDCIATAVRSRQTGNFSSAIINSAGIGGSNGAILLRRTNTGSLPNAAVPRIGIDQVAWILPEGVGAAADLTALRGKSAEDPDDKMASFSAKPYLQSVKGYLDPTGAAALSAAALCLRGQTGELPPTRAGMGLVSATTFGPLSSGYKFFEQMQQRGPAMASPMIFPHHYSSTPGNLAAIEFGIAGPHLIFDHVHDLSVPFDAAQALIATGRTTQVLILLYEHAFRPSLPDGAAVGSGAIALLVSATGKGALLPAAESCPSGVVNALLRTVGAQ